jgi:membrane-associated phospholipid phosphatase
MRSVAFFCLLAGLVLVRDGSTVPARDVPARIWRWPLLGISMVELDANWSGRLVSATPAQIVFWDEHPLDAWFSEAFEAVAGQRKDPPRASRAYAYLAAGVYDAVVDSARVRIRGSEVSTFAAVAGSASTILAELFPELPPIHVSMLADQAASAEIGAGEDPAAVRAGLAIGVGIANRLLAWARRDGYARVWVGTPRRPWEDPPGRDGPLVEPLAGTWRTWLLSSGAALRPGPPPAIGSAELRAEAVEVLDRSRHLDPYRERAALFWSAGQGTPLPAGQWNQIALDEISRHDLSLPEAARLLAALNMALADAGVAAWDAKYAFWQPRPVNVIRDLGLAPRWRPLLDTPVFPSYVSGHSTYSAAAAEVLAFAFPEDAALLRAKAREAAISRIDGGIHFRSDVEVGLRMGRQIGDLAVRWLSG